MRYWKKQRTADMILAFLLNNKKALAIGAAAGFVIGLLF